jgi:hypothetical protein
MFTEIWITLQMSNDLQGGTGLTEPVFKFQFAEPRKVVLQMLSFDCYEI